MPSTSRLVDSLFGLSVISWAALGTLKSDPDERWTIVRITVTLLNLLVGVLLLVRSAPLKIGSPGSILITLPSVFCSAIAFKLSAPFHQWTPFSETVFLSGGMLTLVSFLFLGKNFSIVPAIRSVSISGPYRYIRHPAYLGEVMMVCACAISSPFVLSILILLFSILCTAIRVLAEEKLLSSQIEYQKYQATTKWKLIPFIW